MKIWVVFIMALAVCYGLTILVKYLAARMKVVDIPGDRKIHDSPVPSLGGIAILLSFIICNLIFNRMDRHLAGILISSLVISVVGMVDDIYKSRGKDMAWWIKLFGQVGSAAILVASGVIIHYFRNPLGGMVYLQPWQAIPLTILWVVTLTNAINFIDGLDGMAAGVCSISSLAFLIAALKLHMAQAAIMAAALLGSCLGFLKHNFHPASIFMGDAGANFLGFVLGAISVAGVLKSAAALSLAIPVLALGFPIFDIVFNVIRRLRVGKSIVSADKGHSHHQLLRWGLNQVQTVLFIYLISFCLALMAILVVVTA